MFWLYPVVVHRCVGIHVFCTAALAAGAVVQGLVDVGVAVKAEEIAAVRAPHLRSSMNTCPRRAMD